MKKPHLVPGWKKSYKWLSMNMMAVAASLQVTWMTLPDDMKSSLPSEWVSGATAFLLAAGMAGRLISQPSGNISEADKRLDGDA